MILDLVLDDDELKNLKEDLSRRVRLGCGVNVTDDVEIEADGNNKGWCYLTFTLARGWADMRNLVKLQDEFDPQYAMTVEQSGKVVKVKLSGVDQANLDIDYRIAF